MDLQKLLVIDGHSMAFRSFYALKPQFFQNAQGEYTNAVYGFTKTLLRLIKEQQPTYIAVAFDLPGGTFRTRKYTEYKGGRKPTPEEFKGQIELIQDVLDTLGIKWFTVPDFEADDIVATLSAKASTQGMQTIIVSGDKDSYQLVNEQVSVLYPIPHADMLFMTPTKVLERTGVLPQNYGDLAALVGEGADNIPGVPGVGPKTAVKWINKYGDLENIIANADKITGKVGASLRGHLSQLRLNREINTLITDLEVGEDFSELLPQGVEKTEFLALFDRLQFNSLRNIVLTDLPLRNMDGSLPAVSAQPAHEMQIIDNAKCSLQDFLLENNAPLAMVVGGSLRPAAGYVDKFALANAQGQVFSADYSQLSTADLVALHNWLADPKREKITYSAKGLIHAWQGLQKEVAGIINDVEIMAFLVAPDRHKSDLSWLVQEYLGIDLEPAQVQDTLGFDESGLLLNDPLPQYAFSLFALQSVLEERLVTKDLLELELAVSQVLAQMEDSGILVDVKRLSELWDEFNAEVKTAEHFAYDAIKDQNVNLSSPKQLQEVLFTRLELPKTKKTRSGYTTGADELLKLLQKISNRNDDNAVRGQEFISALLKHKESIKRRQSVESLRKALYTDNSIHTTFQQTVAATGRLSSTDPNLQNIQARSEAGLQIREVFVPRKEYDVLLTADYSQIEMRLMAHLSQDESLIMAFNEGADLHKYVASRVFNVPESAVSAQQRSRTKAISYGLVYGLSEYGLSSQLDIGVFEARALMNDYFTRFGKVKSYLDSLVAQASREGYTETIFGRRRYLPNLASTNHNERASAQRQALNAPIQGSAADLMKIAMVKVADALKGANLRSRMLLQVHDELVLEVLNTELSQVQEIVTTQMANAVKLSVPLAVETGVGYTWRDAAHS